MHYEENEAIKSSKQKTLEEETIPFYLDKLDTIAKENNGYLAIKKGETDI